MGKAKLMCQRLQSRCMRKGYASRPIAFSAFFQSLSESPFLGFRCLALTVKRRPFRAWIEFWRGTSSITCYLNSSLSCRLSEVHALVRSRLLLRASMLPLRKKTVAQNFSNELKPGFSIAQAQAEMAAIMIRPLESLATSHSPLHFCLTLCTQFGYD